MISRPPSLRRLDPVESELGEIEPIDERVDRSNWVVLVDPVVQAFRKQRALAAIYSLDEALHPIPPGNRDGIVPHESRQVGRFHTAWVKGGHRRHSALGSLHLQQRKFALLFVTSPLCHKR